MLQRHISSCWRAFKLETAMRLCVWAAVAAIALARAPRLETTHTCYADGAWSDTCVYTNVCFNGSAGDMIVITDRLDDWHKPRGIPGTFAGMKLLLLEFIYEWRLAGSRTIYCCAGWRALR